jgi:hypothetical protein
VRLDVSLLRLDVDDQHEHERDEVEPRGDDEGVAQPHESDHARADDRPERRAESLRRLHEPNRLRHPAFRRRLGRHRQRQRPVAGEDALNDAQRHQMPRHRDKSHRGHQDDERGERSQHHELAPVAIGQPSPRRRQERRHGRRHAQRHSRPHGNAADVGLSHLLDVDREKRHHDGESREADEHRGDERSEVAAPVGWRGNGCGLRSTNCGPRVRVGGGHRRQNRIVTLSFSAA